MPARSIWKGFIRLSLVSVPVKAYTASATATEIHLRQLHKDCHSPIKYQKVCPLHGELTAGDIVSGYEYAKGQFVVLDVTELDKLRTEAEKAVTIEGFVTQEAIDPLYFAGKTYYLVPDGAVGQKPYALLHQGMMDEGCQAVAQAVLFGREHVLLLRPVDRLIAMSTLFYHDQVKEPGSFHDEVSTTPLADAELKLTKTLIEASTLEDFNLARYKDSYNEKLTALIHAKVEGREVVAPPASDHPKVINLMDALKESVEEARRKSTGKAAPKKMAPSARRVAGEKKKRKSG